MLLALEAAKEGDTLEARGSLQRSLDARPEVVRFLHVPEGRCHERGLRAGGPDRRGISHGVGGVGGVVLFDARGERLRPAPLEVKEGDVTSVAFGPEGKIAAGYARGGGGGVVLFDARGERLRPAPLEVKEGEVTSVAFGPRARSPRDMAAATAAAWCSSTPVASGSDPRRWRSRRARSASVAFGPEGKIAAGYSVAGGAAAWCSSTPGASGSDPRRWRSRRAMSRAWPSGRRARSPRDMAPPRRGRRRRRGALRRPGRAAPTRPAGGQGGRCHERGLRAGGQDRRGIWRRLGFGRGYGVGGVVLFDARGERLRPDPLEVKEGSVTSVAFGPEGKIAAGYGGCVSGGVVLFDARGERLRPAPLEVKEGDVTSVAFGPEGKIAAGYRRPFAQRRRRRGALRRPGRAAPTRRRWRSRRALSRAWPSGRRARSPRDMAGRGGAAAWCSSTPVASGSDPRRWRSRRAMSRAWPSGRRARSPRDMRVDGGGGGVVLFDARGERLRPAPLEVKEGECQ